MAVGALKTLLTTLQASTFLAGVTVAFGEESLPSESLAPPKVVLVPVGGPWSGPGYAAGLDPNIENIWATTESLDCYVCAFSAVTNAQPIDHADEVETVRQKLLSALQEQRNMQATDGSNLPGLYWKPISGRWLQMAPEFTFDRYGRVYVLTVMAEISVPTDAPVESTVGTLTVNQSLTGAQHVA